jgi:hypothetical protein
VSRAKCLGRRMMNQFFDDRLLDSMLRCRLLLTTGVTGSGRPFRVKMVRNPYIKDGSTGRRTPRIKAPQKHQRCNEDFEENLQSAAHSSRQRSDEVQRSETSGPTSWRNANPLAAPSAIFVLVGQSRQRGCLPVCVTCAPPLGGYKWSSRLPFSMNS